MMKAERSRAEQSRAMKKDFLQKTFALLICTCHLLMDGIPPGEHPESYVLQHVLLLAQLTYLPTLPTYLARYVTQSMHIKSNLHILSPFLLSFPPLLPHKIPLLRYLTTLFSFFFCHVFPRKYT